MKRGRNNIKKNTLKDKIEHKIKKPKKYYSIRTISKSNMKIVVAEA